MPLGIPQIQFPQSVDWQGLASRLNTQAQMPSDVQSTEPTVQPEAPKMDMGRKIALALAALAAVRGKQQPLQALQDVRVVVNEQHAHHRAGTFGGRGDVLPHPYSRSADAVIEAEFVNEFTILPLSRALARPVSNDRVIDTSEDPGGTGRQRGRWQRCENLSVPRVGLS